MKADDANLLDLLKKSTQFVVPIYQRIYSWGREECRRLWDDVLHAGADEAMGSHFTGSIVYVERGEGTRTSAEPDLIIDGQQRVTTVMLLLAALAERLESLPENDKEPVEGFTPVKIRNRYLTNSDEDGEARYKLILSKTDRNSFMWVIGQDRPRPEGESSRVLTNYDLFCEWLAEEDIDLTTVCLGLRKLVVVDVKLSRGSDNPQLVFETMNSTGKKLSQADLIRNFVLMDLAPSVQTRLYENYWAAMEKMFSGANERQFDEFVRHYLTARMSTIPRVDKIYDAFKAFAQRQDADGVSRQELIEALHRHAGWFTAIALGAEKNRQLAEMFRDLELLKATVTYPFLLRVYGDYAAGLVSVGEFAQIVAMVTSYVFRRAVCRIPTNSLNTTFASLSRAEVEGSYVDYFTARLVLPTTNTRFPTDEEFTEHLLSLDMYNFGRRLYFFRRLENYGRKELVSTADYTIEHILPQNPDLPPEWRSALGPEWKHIQERHLHTLGNLTLTGYNSEYSDRPFAQKRDMEGGFAQSPLRLNEGLGRLESWGEEQIQDRARRLTAEAVQVWQRPALSDSMVRRYRAVLGGGFDWSTLHAMLTAIPEGRWTTYQLVADAVGTWPQPLASHLAKCRECVGAYRVLTSEGRVAENFAWSDPSETRSAQEVLESEGVRFDGAVADHAQRLSAEELSLLMEE